MDIICAFCLSSDRNLKIIKEDHWKIFDFLFDEDQKTYVNIQNLHLENQLRICWECEGRINKFCNFIKCAQKSYVMFVQYFVLGETVNPLMPVSKLFTTDMETITLLSDDTDNLDIKYEEKILYSSNIGFDEVVTVPDNGFDEVVTVPNQDYELKNVKSEKKKNVTEKSKADDDESINDDGVSNADDDVSHADDDDDESDECVSFADELPQLNTVDSAPKKPKRIAKPKSKIQEDKRQKRYSPRDSQVSWVLESEAVQWYKEERAADRAANPTFHHQCDACERVFNNRDQLDIHIDEHHSEAAGPCICSLCNYRFQNAMLLIRHQDKHYIKYLCNKCDYETRVYSDMDSHGKEKHDQMFRCARCKEEISRKKRRSHLKNCSHYKCSYCEETYSDRSNYTIHIKSHKKQSEGTTYCEGCQRYIRNTWYKKHFSVTLTHVSRDMWKYTCTHCGEKRHSASMLRQHVFSVHLKRGAYHCSMCPNKYMSKAQLNRHHSLQHKTGSYKRARDKICELCGKGFLCNTTLKHHRLTHTGERPFKCEYCTATYTNHGSLYTHNLNVHQKKIGKRSADAERATCNECGKTYPSNALLNHHFKIKHLKFRYECDLCDKNFASKFALKNHKVREHNHVANCHYNCDECGKPFETERGMKNHRPYCPALNVGNIKKRTTKQCQPSNKQYKCRECGEPFKVSSSLYAHYKTKHLHLRCKDRVSIKNLFDLTKEVVVTRDPALKSEYTVKRNRPSGSRSRALRLPDNDMGFPNVPL